MGQLIKWGLIILACILVYNYFFGTDPEKERSRQVFTQVGGLFKSVKDVVKAERAQLDSGKYDEAIDKLTNIIGSLKTEAKNSGDQEALARIKDLEAERDQLEKNVEGSETSGLQKAADKAQRAIKLKKDLDALIRETEDLANDMEAKSN
jgi:hypothetical protein